MKCRVCNIALRIDSKTDICKKCYVKEYYKKNKKLMVLRSLLYNKRKKLKNKQKALNLFNNKCNKCGLLYNNRNISVFDFHHIKDKNPKICKDLFQNKWNIIEKEIKNCILLCSNCHRMEHSNYEKEVAENITRQQKHYKTPINKY